MIMSLLVLRRTTGLGAPPWTPPRTVAGLAFAVPFGAVGLLLLVYGIIGLLAPAQNSALSYLTAGLSACAISLVAIRRLQRRPLDNLLETADDAI